MADPLFEALLNTTVVIKRNTRVTDNQGGWPSTRGAGTEVIARVRPASGGERTDAAQRSVELTHVVYLPFGTDVNRDDQLVHGTKSYTVRAVRTPSEPHHLEVDVEEVQRGR